MSSAATPADVTSSVTPTPTVALPSSSESDSFVVTAPLTPLSQIEYTLKNLSNEEARAELMKRAMLLLGLSEELKDSERGVSMKKDADELLAFANELRSSEHATIVMDQASTLLSTLSNKYGDQSSKLYSDLWSTYNSMAETAEAKQLLSESTAILSQWDSYAHSDKGKDLVHSLAQRLGDQAKNSGQYVLEVYSSITDQRGHVDKEKMSVATSAASAVFAEDEDVKALLEKSQQALGLKAGEEKKDGSTTNAIDAAGKLLDGAEEKLKELKKSDLGRTLLAKGAELLKTNSALLSPDQIIGQSQSMMSDTEARQQFINKCKDMALEFLLNYLPTVSVPPVSGHKDGTDYELSGIDLSKFKVKKEDVSVVIDEHGVGIHAKEISCTMNDLKYKYRRNALLKGKGAMDAFASQATFDIKLTIDTVVPPRVPKRPWQQPQPTHATTPSQGSAPSETAATTPAPSAPASATSPDAQKPAEEKMSAMEQYLAMLNDESAASTESENSQLSTTIAPASTTTNTHPATSATTAALSPSSTMSVPAVTSSSSSPVRSSPSPAPPAASDGIATAAETVDSSAASSPSTPAPDNDFSGATKLASKVVDALSESHRTEVTPSLRLKIVSIAIAVPHFKLIVKGESMSSAILNFFLRLFSSHVRQYVETVMNQEVVKQSEHMMKTINTAAADYLPFIYRIVRKAEKLLEKSAKAVTVALQDNEKKKEKTATPADADVRKNSDSASPDPAATSSSTRLSASASPSAPSPASAPSTPSPAPATPAPATTAASGVSTQKQPKASKPSH